MTACVCSKDYCRFMCLVCYPIALQGAADVWCPKGTFKPGEKVAFGPEGSAI